MPPHHIDLQVTPLGLDAERRLAVPVAWCVNPRTARRTTAHRSHPARHGTVGTPRPAPQYLHSFCRACATTAGHTLRYICAAAATAATAAGISARWHDWHDCEGHLERREYARTQPRTQRYSGLVPAHCAWAERELPHWVVRRRQVVLRDSPALTPQDPGEIPGKSARREPEARTRECVFGARWHKDMR